MTESVTLGPGSPVRHFQIVEVLGAGGMGVVFKARDVLLGRFVALKVLSNELFENEMARTRFLREAQLAAHVTHPNVATIYEIDVEHSRPFIAMELVPGRTLKSLVSPGPLPTEQVVAIGLQICDALEAAHQAGLVHRDIKASNIMVTPNGVVKVLDFGLAKALEDERVEIDREPTWTRDDPTATARLSPTYTGSGRSTARGVLIGTPSYMSPEQTLGRPVDRRSDLFSLGVVLYEALSGKLPFTGGSPNAVLEAIRSSEPPPLSQSAAGVPVGLSRMIGRCLAKDPLHRYQTAAELRQALATLQRAGSPRRVLNWFAETLVVPVRTGSRWARLAAGAGIVALLALIVVLLLMGRGPSGPDARQLSVAVMPCENIGDPGDEYLAQGVTEALINELSRLAGVRMVSLDAVLHYRGKEVAPPDAARELGVDNVLLSSLQRAGPRIRIAARLVRVSDGAQIWAERYEKTMGDVFEIQDAVALAVGSALQLQLRPAPRSSPAKTTRSLQAYELYLQGRHAFYQYNRAGIERAIDLYRQALAIDPDFALAHAGLALCYGQHRSFMWDMDPVWLDRAFESAQRAVEPDLGLAEPHFALGFVHYLRNQPELALEQLARAIEINPNHDHARSFSGFIHYSAQGRLGLAIQDYEQALQLNPFLLSALWHYGHLLALAGESERAMKHLDKALQLAPRSEYAWMYRAAAEVLAGQHQEARRSLEQMRDSVPPNALLHYAAGQLQLLQGQLPEALREFDASLEREPAYFLSLAGRAHALFRLKRFAEAIQACDRALEAPDYPYGRVWYSHLSLRALRILALRAAGRTGESDEERRAFLSQQLEPLQPFDAYHAARAYALLGRRDEALLWLRRAMEDGFLAAAVLRLEPDLKSLRADSDFSVLLEEMKQSLLSSIGSR